MRHLGQRISEGDGIALIAHVDDADAARAAEQDGAKAIAVARAIDGIREATTLPLLWLGDSAPVDADACAVDLETRSGDGVEAVALVRDEEELEAVLEALDPEIFLLAGRGDDDDRDPLDEVLDLLADVPAGKLAIAHVEVETREDVLALERAGMDAVLVPGGLVGTLVGHGPVDV
jgi:hypothetical protein